MSLPQLISQGISLMEGQNNNSLPGVFTEFLQSRGVNMNELWSPPVDMVEDDTTIHLYVNIPGVATDSLDVDFFNNYLEIKGERNRPFTAEADILKNEIIYGRFARKVTLPISVTSRESVKIHAENGVMVVTIDKAREERNRFSMRVGNGGVQTSGDASITLNSNNLDEEDEDEDEDDEEDEDEEDEDDEEDEED